MVLVGFGVMFAAGTAAVHAAIHGVVRSLELTLEEPPAPPASGHIPGWDDGAERKELTDGRLGGSLLPTTAGDDDGTDEETPPTPGSATPTGTATDLDRSSEPPGGTGSSPSGDGGTDERDIEPYEETTDELERKRDGE